MLISPRAPDKQTKLQEQPNHRYWHFFPAVVLVLFFVAAWHSSGLSPVDTRSHETTLRLVVVNGSWDHLPSLCS